MSLKLTTDAAEAAVNAIVDQVDVGTGNAQVIVWSGEEPPSIGDSIDAQVNVVLATFGLAQPAFGPAAVVGSAVESLALNIANVSASASGEASFFRIYNRDGDVVMQGEVSQDASAALTINQSNIVSGAEVEIIRFVIGMEL